MGFRWQVRPIGAGRRGARPRGGMPRESSREPFGGGELGRQVLAGDFSVEAGLHTDEKHVTETEGAVSAVIARLPCTISLIRRCDTSIALAIRFCEMSLGLRNSLMRRSPG